MAHSGRRAGRITAGALGLIGLSVVAGVLIAATVTPAAAVTSTAASTAIDLFQNLPSALNIDKLILPSTIYYKNAQGKEVPMATYYDQNRDPVTWDQVSPVMFDAILSSEDPRYYEQGAVDPMGIARALLSNADGGAVQGASTISQQYVKNVLMQQCDWNAHTGSDFTKCYNRVTDDSGIGGYQRKLQELRYAVALEQKYSKNDILLGYLNIVNFGGTTYGIQAAAEHYFGVSADQLTLSQAATLAGMVQSPNIYRIDEPAGTFRNSAGQAVNSRADHYSATKQRQEYVLGQMLRYGKITEAQYDAAMKAPIVPNVKNDDLGCSSSIAPYFCSYVTDIIRSNPAFGSSETKRTELLHRGGLKIYTTLDPRVQTILANAQKEYNPAYIPGMDFGSTSVSVQASTGRVLGMAQNTNYLNGGTPQPGYRSTIYAGDQANGGSIGFAPGSSFKLFTMLAWLEAGKSVNASVNGNVRTYSDWNDSCLPNGKLITAPTVMGNYNNEAGYQGTPMQFTAQSLNSGYLAMANELDLCNIGKMATRLGVTLTNGDPVPLAGRGYPKNRPAPFEVLGIDPVSPMAMAGAYATIANGGVHCTPHVIDSVTNAQGEPLPVPQASCTQVIPPNIAATAAYAFQGVMTQGTGVSGNPFDGTPLLGKTGTDGALQTWLDTSSTAVTTANWVGNANGNANLNHIYAHGNALANIRYPLARTIQGGIDKIYPGGAFPAPDPTLTTRPYVPPVQTYTAPANPAPAPSQSPAPKPKASAPPAGGDNGGSGGGGHGGGPEHGGGPTHK